VTAVRAISAAAAVAMLAACGAQPPGAASPGAVGDPAQGAAIIQQAQCGACHEIPGVADAHGLVGPPLTEFGRRTMVAGMLPNTPDALVRWLRDPQGVTPGNGMPDTHLTDRQARDVAAYLYTLR
jgi:cytochrome c1